MSYCEGKSKAKVNYQFPGGLKDTYVSDSPPIDVVVESVNPEQILTQSTTNSTFDGSTQTTYNFSINAPDPVPDNADVFLISGRWDDIGSIGSFTSPNIPNQHNVYDGIPLHIGRSGIVKGTVTNTIIGQCSLTISLQWRLSTQYGLKVLKDGVILHQVTGNGYPKFDVSCDEGCPPHHIRCEITSYPGFCCISCESIAQRINNLAARI